MSGEVDPAVVAPGETALAEPQVTTPLKVAATMPPPQLEAPRLAREPRILDLFERDVRRCGVVGEERLAATVYLALTSRLLDNTVSVAVKGTSSSGKSFTVETTSRFFPSSAFIAMTAMSERALVYMKESYSHRTLILYEAAALREGAENNLTAYFVRSLLSEGRISYPVTTRDKEGNWTTKTIVKEGPTNLVLTTTATQLHGENETRLISVPTNDTPEQTKAVLLRLAEENVTPTNLRQWQELQTWLQTAEHRVTIPYATWLAVSIPPVAVRLRRDFGAILSLIRAHAILHQYTRTVDSKGYIVASEEDYLVVRGLVADLVSDGVGATVPPTMRETVECIRGLEASQIEGVTAAAVARDLGLDKSAARRRLIAAAGQGYVVNLEDRRGRPGRYLSAEPMPTERELLPPAVPVCYQTQYVSAGHASGGMVAAQPEGAETLPDGVGARFELERAPRTNSPDLNRAVDEFTAAFPGTVLIDEAELHDGSHQTRA
jgi:hypothetical protein